MDFEGNSLGSRSCVNLERDIMCLLGNGHSRPHNSCWVGLVDGGREAAIELEGWIAVGTGAREGVASVRLQLFLQ